MKILVVDDDLELLGLVAYVLRQSGYLVIEAADGPSALRCFAEEKPDLAVLDVNLPGMNGFDVLKEARARGNRTPVMMLTVRSGEEDQVRALDLGADDYITKPFSPRSLLARIRALLRRAGLEHASDIRAGHIVIDVERQAVSLRGGTPVSLTRLEFRLLQLLVANAGHVLPSERLTAHVWGYRDTGDRQQLKQLVHRLRQKIEDEPASPRYIVTESGIGYRLDPEPASPN